MKKQLPIDDISNELSGSSVFFSKETDPSENAPFFPEKNPAPASQAAPNQKTGEQSRPDKAQVKNHGVTQPRNRDTMKPSHHDTMINSFEDTKHAPMLDTVRQAVKQLGKEAATHRFTQAEKQQLGDLIYAYNRKGVRTSENELTRIAVNWLLLDHKERGAHSVLARVLDALHG